MGTSFGEAQVRRVRALKKARISVEFNLKNEWISLSRPALEGVFI
jgi:hypothetical protein